MLIITNLHKSKNEFSRVMSDIPNLIHRTAALPELPPPTVSLSVPPDNCWDWERCKMNGEKI
jgi:hypothetical protein